MFILAINVLSLCKFVKGEKNYPHSLIHLLQLQMYAWKARKSVVKIIVSVMLFIVVMMLNGYSNQTHERELETVPQDN